MNYFSGFGLEGEENLFLEFIKNSDFCVAGFSFGAISAFEYVNSYSHRVDILQLISPAYFQGKASSFKKAQIMSFKKSKAEYMKKFYQNSTSREDIIKPYKKSPTLEELIFGVEYIWSRERLESLKKRGVNIEIYLGECDNIVDVKAIKEFFLDFADVYYLKNRDHFLLLKE